MAGPEASAPAVAVDGVSKRFRIPHERVSTLKERAMHPLRRPGHDEFDALRNVSFAVEQGEFFGIVGRNGSGKSTLLKCMAGIYRTDAGAIYVNGRVSTFIELGVGFNQDLAARDNVLLNGVMLGLSPREARDRYQRVIEFAELERFEELKLKNYSSGMQVRLAFSVMVQVDADILLIDEVLAVGDVGFQQKCFDVFNRLRDEGKTILFVTHDMAAVRRFCHRALLIENGEIVRIGSPEDVANSYMDLSFGKSLEDAMQEDAERTGDGTAEIVDAWWEDERGERHGMVHQARACSFHARVRFHTDVEDPTIATVFENEYHQPLMATVDQWTSSGRTGSFRSGDEAEFTVQFEMAFAPGRVFASPWVSRGPHHIMERRPRVASVIVAGPHVSGGLVDLPHDVRLEAGDRVPQGEGGAVSQLDTAALGRPIRGPSALGSDLRRMLHLSVTLAVMEFKLRFFGSVLGYLWQLMRPLLLFGVLYVVFTEFVRLGEGVRFYPAVLLTGIVLFTFFSDATSRSVTAVADREGMVRKIEFPRLVVPLAVLLIAYFNLVLNLLAVLVFVLITGVDPRVEWLALPLLLVALGLFAGGLTMLLSALYPRFRDVQPIWEVVLQVIFYGSPILYVIDVLPSEQLRHLVVTLNPLATILVQARHSLIDETAPNAWDAAGGIQYLVIPAAIVVGLALLGFYVFNREAPRIAEEL